MDDLAKLLILFGIGITLTGAVLFLVARAGLGRLPGDFVFQSGNMTCIVPIVTSIILSVVLTIILNVVLAFLRK
ncbi:MAG TPA: DUF2905 domain-containing protein [Anaerolineae bacterium]|nr:DUF2905 domain-containing protein [Anaerolineae bacterium]